MVGKLSMETSVVYFMPLLYNFKTSSGEITKFVEFLWTCQLSRQLFHFAWLWTDDGCLNKRLSSQNLSTNSVCFELHLVNSINAEIFKEEHGLALLARFLSPSV
ncbi:Uncharacterized protein APZ42_030270 [Daphnia magna]|uniref:Uncharacterized protein n=1 Tax=Daphnia magna TaxID=35525 RepID=A0A0P5LN64_9CRUS|nr:Uncharacterized protein APZ42_030270 [Daphnia magna]